MQVLFELLLVSCLPTSQVIKPAQSQCGRGLPKVMDMERGIIRDYFYNLHNSLSSEPLTKLSLRLLIVLLQFWLSMELRAGTAGRNLIAKQNQILLKHAQCSTFFQCPTQSIPPPLCGDRIWLSVSMEGKGSGLWASYLKLAAGPWLDHLISLGLSDFILLNSPIHSIDTYLVSTVW